MLPEAKAKVTGTGDIIASGGWLDAMSKELTKNVEVDLYTATASDQVKELQTIKGKRITHFVFPMKSHKIKYEKSYEQYWTQIINVCNPDIVHIHGTECPHSVPCVNLFPSLNYIVSIQGLVGEIAKHYCDGLTSCTIIKNITPRDIYKGTLFHDRKSFYKRSKFETFVLKSVKYVIGRTSWDRAVVSSINPDIQYFIGNESLRDEFYDGNWEYANCTPHVIFLSQVGWSYKGFHQLLRALPMIIYHYPDVKVRIAGEDVIRCKGGWKDKIKLNNYGKILRSMIDESGLSDRIEFLGRINALEMKNELLNANVFVSCSSIDNSPNSLGEAQLLGVPCVASYVGGVPDMVPNNLCGYLYRYEDYQNLAFLICRVLEESPSFNNEQMRYVARTRHNREKNARDLLDIYNKIHCQNKS